MKSKSNITRQWSSRVLCGVGLAWLLTGCADHHTQPRSVARDAVSSAEVTIRTESDFYEPLRPYGRWEIVGAYGRCWIPTQVDRDWRPYCNGSWQRTAAGWYWASAEPWAWATYHYGRWNVSARYGWYWMPKTQWAPAWVSWRQGGGYIGWAPLSPSANQGRNGYVEINEPAILPRYVFVEERHFRLPVHPTTVIVNNPAILKQTAGIARIKIVNNIVINEGPPVTVAQENHHESRPASQ